MTYDTSSTDIYTLSYTTLFRSCRRRFFDCTAGAAAVDRAAEISEGAGSRQERTAQRNATVARHRQRRLRSEEHTSELQSRRELVCRVLLEQIKSKLYKILLCDI